MNSREPYSEDELSHLVRGALKARVSGQSPPDRVWKQIRQELEVDQPPPSRVRMPWSPVVLQAALTMLLAVLGGVGLQTLLNTGDVGYPTRVPAPSASVVQMEVPSASPVLAMDQDKDELRLLRAVPQPSPEQQVDNQAASQPPISVPRDAPPNVNSPEGRALKSEISGPPEIAEHYPLRGGPYPWFK
jgi:hypothetical protein